MAAKEGLSPQEICDKCKPDLPFAHLRSLTRADRLTGYAADNKLHAEAYEWFEIGFDHFGRTSDPMQTV